MTWMIAAALVAKVPVIEAPSSGRWRQEITEASIRFAIPPSWIASVMRAESSGIASLHGKPTTSGAGAMGLMQLMPGTWSEMRIALGLGADPFEPRDNILAGAAYLREMYDRFGYPGLFGAYNAGPDRYRRYVAGEAKLPSETVLYLMKTGASRQMISVGGAQRPGGRSWTNAQDLFALRDERRSGSAKRKHSLFAISHENP